MVFSNLLPKIKTKLKMLVKIKMAKFAYVCKTKPYSNWQPVKVRQMVNFKLVAILIRDELGDLWLVLLLFFDQYLENKVRLDIRS